VSPVFTGLQLGNMFESTLRLSHHRKKLGPRPRSRRDTSSAEFHDYRLGVHVPNFFLLRNVGIERLVLVQKLSIIPSQYFLLNWLRIVDNQITNCRVKGISPVFPIDKRMHFIDEIIIELLIV